VGVPDQTDFPTTVLNYQQTIALGTPYESSDTWDGEFYFFPDPTVFGTYSVRDEDNTHHAVGMILNSALASPSKVLGVGVGSALDDAVSTWLGSFERWRMAYYGVTVYLDAPALANQGSVVSAQYCVRPVYFGRGYADTGAGDLKLGQYPAVEYHSSDVPGYDTLMQMPNSYTGLMKDGVYIPLKMDSNHAVWHDANDACVDASAWELMEGAPQYNVPGTVVTSSGLYPGLTSGYFVPGGSLEAVKANARPKAAAVKDACEPSPPERERGIVPPPRPFVPKYRRAGIAGWGGDPHLLPCSANIAGLAFTGISKDARIRLAFRVGFECQAQPGTMYAPFLKISPGFDRSAIDMYFRIARELKDAYPAEYNDFGKLWEIIKNVAGKVAPAIGAIPTFGPMAVGAAKLLGAGIDTLIAPKERKGKGPSKQSQKKAAIETGAAQKERNQEAAKEAVKRSSRPRAKPKKKGSGFLGR